MRFLAVVLVALCFTQVTHAQPQQKKKEPESYLCVLDLLTGFTEDETSRQWRRANFKQEEKYLLTRSNDPKAAWVVRRLGSAATTSWCRSDFNEDSKLFCEGFSDFKFNRKKLRFIYINTFGNSFLDEHGSDDIGIGIGKCTPL